MLPCIIIKELKLVDMTPARPEGSTSWFSECRWSGSPDARIQEANNVYFAFRTHSIACTDLRRLDPSERLLSGHGFVGCALTIQSLLSAGLPAEKDSHMNENSTGSSKSVLTNLDGLLPDLEAVYKDIHTHPELSMQETRTAGIAADRLHAAGYQVTTGVGKTGVVGLLCNGEGPTVMLRADMDALPVEEATGLPYASNATATGQDGKMTPVMHACGHDMHVTWLVGATTLLAKARDGWRGTVMAVFQPAEETAAGAQAMIDDGLFKRFPKPDVVLGQHVMVWPAGVLGCRAGVITSAGDSLQIRLFGRGAHGSMPQASIDPVVMAAATVMRLQAIVSREVAATEAAVVTVGSLQAGTKENVIADEAVIKLNVRTFDEGVRKRVLAAVERIVNAEAAASGAPKPRRSRRWIATLSSRMILQPLGEWLIHSAGTFLKPAYRRPNQHRQAKTSGLSEPSGTFHRCSGSSVALTRMFTLKPKSRAGSASFPRTIARALHRLFIPRSSQAWRRLS